MTTEERLTTLEQELAEMKEGRAVAEEVRVRRLVLVDDEGRKRAALDMGPDGPTLRLFDENGVPREMLFVGAELSMLDLADAAGKPRATLVVGADVSRLFLFDAAGKVIWSTP